MLFCNFKLLIFKTKSFRESNPSSYQRQSVLLFPSFIGLDSHSEIHCLTFILNYSAHLHGYWGMERK
jgi:hypothetical protein